MLSLLSEGKKKESASEAAPRIILKWPLVNVTMLVSGAGDISLSSQQQMTFLEYLKNVGLIVGTLIQFLCVTLQIAGNHTSTLYTEKVRLPSKFHFYRTPNSCCPYQRWKQSYTHGCIQDFLCSYAAMCVCMCACVHACTCKFYNGYSTILQAFCLYLQYFPPSLKLTLNVTKLDRYCSITQCNTHRELTIQNINLQNSSLDESSSITRLVTACRGDECVTASSSRGADSISLIPALHDRLALVK